MNITEKEWAEIQRRQNTPTVTPPMGPAGLLGAAVSAAVVGAGRSRKPNGWESEYGMTLEARKRTGEILWYAYEPIRMRLADRTSYCPDFLVILPTMKMQVVEVKGHLRSAGNIKFKVAAEMFPFAEFFMYRKKRVKEGGGWELIKHLNGGRP